MTKMAVKVVAVGRTLCTSKIEHLYTRDMNQAQTGASAAAASKYEIIMLSIATDYHTEAEESLASMVPHVPTARLRNN